MRVPGGLVFRSMLASEMDGWMDGGGLEVELATGLGWLDSWWRERG
jgi:hypothetical protein